MASARRTENGHARVSADSRYGTNDELIPSQFAPVEGMRPSSLTLARLRDPLAAGMGYNNQYGVPEWTAPFRRPAARYLTPLGKALVSVAALIYLLHSIDRSAMIEAVRSTRGWFLIF